MSFRDAIAELNELKDDGLVADYAIAGATGAMFWTEPIATYDLDVIVALEGKSPLVDLGPIYSWAAARGFTSSEAHLMIRGVPVQLLPVWHPLAEESLREAATVDYQGIPTRVVRLEHLIALALLPPADSPRRRERAALMREASTVDRKQLDAILGRHGLRF